MSRTVASRVYVISDLHIGGQPPAANDPIGRGFRIFTHSPELVAFVDSLTVLPAAEPTIELVVNGDFIDFLAERDANTNEWFAIKPADAALTAFNAICTREAELFLAFGRFLRKGHRLTIILGNHDVELCYPAVRQALEIALGIDGHQNLHFVYDGEGYVVGDTIFEHGNRYDCANVNDSNSFRELRSLMSRREAIPSECWRPSPGSQLVASVMNPIKEPYPFIDLLKPETGAAVPLLLALDPSLLRKLRPLIPILIQAGANKVNPRPGLREFAQEGISSRSDPFDDNTAAFRREAPPDQSLDDLLIRQMGQQSADRFRRSLAASTSLDRGGSTRTMDFASPVRTVGEWAGSLMDLLRRADMTKLENRLPALLEAVRHLRDKDADDRTIEPDGPYRSHICELASRGFKAVVFGHTHTLRQTQIDGAVYLNTGTWADKMQFPPQILTGDDEVAIVKLREFVKDIEAKDFRRWISFTPTYGVLSFGAESVLLDAELRTHDGGSIL